MYSRTLALRSHPLQSLPHAEDGRFCHLVLLRPAPPYVIFESLVRLFQFLSISFERVPLFDAPPSRPAPPSLTAPRMPEWPLFSNPFSLFYLFVSKMMSSRFPVHSAVPYKDTPLLHITPPSWQGTAPCRKRLLLRSSTFFSEVLSFLVTMKFVPQAGEQSECFSFGRLPVSFPSIFRRVLSPSFCLPNGQISHFSFAPHAVHGPVGKTLTLYKETISAERISVCVVLDIRRKAPPPVPPSPLTIRL